MGNQPEESVEELSSIIDLSRPHFIDPLTSLIDFIEETNRVLHLSICGIRLITSMPGAAKALAKAKPSDDADGRIVRTAKIARLAKQEIENEFQLLHAHSVVAVWSALEASIPKFAAGWLAKEPLTLTRPVFEKIKVAVGVL